MDFVQDLGLVCFEGPFRHHVVHELRTTEELDVWICGMELLQVLYCIVQVSEEQQSVLNNHCILWFINDSDVILGCVLFELPHFDLALLFIVVGNYLLQFLHYYVHAAPVLIALVQIQRHEAYLLVLVEEPHLFELVYLVYTIAIL